MHERLTDAFIRATKLPGDKPQIIVRDTTVPGLAVVIGKTCATFVVEARVQGTKRRKALGVLGRARVDGTLWNTSTARIEARQMLGTMASGIDPNAERRAGGPTVRDGVDAHLDRMRKRNRAERSIQTFEVETAKHLADWLDRPFAELDGAALEALIENVKRAAPRRRNRNPANPRGSFVANRLIAHVSAAWRSLNKKLGGKLGTWNPASSVEKQTLRPKRQRIDDEQLPDYAARVGKMRSPIRQDGLMFALYTGLRHEDVREMKLEHVDFDARTLRLPDPKGGPDAAFTIPLSSTPMQILERRKRDNARDLGADPKGFVFPAIAQSGEVGAISNLREPGKKKNAPRVPAEDVHTLRRTYLSIAQQEGVNELDQHVLSNHSFGNRNVNETYVSQHLDHLRKCAERIDAGIKRRIEAKPSPALRSVA